MSNPAPTPAKPTSPGGNYRWTICTLLFFSVAINYIDRNIIGILKKPLGEELHWSEGDYANIAAAFQFAYAFGYLFGGWFIDKMGVKRGLPIAVAVWSFAAAAHGLVTHIPIGAQYHLPWISLGGVEKGLAFITIAGPMTSLGFMTARVGLGLSEGANFPGAIKAIAEWFPQSERALATGLFNAGTNVGAVVCPIVVPWMVGHLGWPSTFYITGGLGFVWLAVWWVLYEVPEKQKRLSAAERAYIEEGASPDAPKVKVPWLTLFKYRAVWAYVIAGILAGPVWGIYMFFLPDFLEKRFEITNLQEVGWWTALFYFIAAFGGVMGGWLPSILLKRGWSINAARKVSLLLCAVAVVPLYAAPYVPSVFLAVIIVGIAGSAHQGWSANIFSFVSDTMPKAAVGAVVGLGGFVSYFTGGFVAKAIGAILEKTGSYASIFAAASLMYLISVFFVHVLVPRIGQADAVANKRLA